MLMCHLGLWRDKYTARSSLAKEAGEEWCADERCTAIQRYFCQHQQQLAFAVCVSFCIVSICLQVQQPCFVIMNCLKLLHVQKSDE